MSLYVSAEDSADNPEFSWDGKFKNQTFEKDFSAETWPDKRNRLGIIGGVGGLAYGLAGIGTWVDLGATPIVKGLTIARLLVSLAGIFLFFASRRQTSSETMNKLWLAFFCPLGIYETVEAVLLYTPNLEFSVPFTLLIIFLMYLLIPQDLKTILWTSSLASILYVVALASFTVPKWTNCIQLALFFIFANILGAYLLLTRLKSERLRFAALQKVQKLNIQLQEEISQKKEINSKLEQLAITDELTGIFNRRHFMCCAEKEQDRFKRYGNTYCLLMFDIDNFKSVNDTHGHYVGDRVLTVVAQTLNSMRRTNDIFGRLGGEEFSMLLPQTELEQGLRLAERMREAISELQFDVPVKQITISIGLSEIGKDGYSFEEVLHQADEALYKAKELGRNQTQLFANKDKKMASQG
ncbi:GGDEF domain-containing protein [Maridesulfovibrio sp.]|uniref:GGDEF domain-containing protein n=1 Tax=Maridesulfovibrio sp. TaxID=2795000 RepID=UPI002A18A3D5|nr:GGDEF domain-containing protein [Maridesulfovibrio sp.]